MNDIGKAIYLALAAHKGQVDKAGEPYIYHPLAVAAEQDTVDGFIVGMLHDVLEDSRMTTRTLKVYGFSPDVIEAVKLLTRLPGEDYMEYVKRIKENELARKVKLSDLRHNSDLSRLPIITEKDRKRVKERYEPAIEILTR